MRLCLAAVAAALDVDVSAAVSPAITDMEAARLCNCHGKPVLTPADLSAAQGALRSRCCP